MRMARPGGKSRRRMIREGLPVLGFYNLGPIRIGQVGTEHRVDDDRAEAPKASVVLSIGIRAGFIGNHCATAEHAVPELRVLDRQQELEGHGEAVVLHDALVVVQESPRMTLPS
jgi:hypothetical protein